MSVWFKRLFAGLFVGLVLTACSPDDSEQRKAFITFLQNDVLAKPGVQLSRPNAEQQKPFGDYAAQYAIITRFHESMDASVAKPMQQVLANALPRSIEDAVNRKADIAAVRAGFGKLREALDTAVATADKERAALKQPEDVAPLYATAYAKLVTAPATTFRDIFPVLDDAFGSVLAFADLIDKNRAGIKLSGSQMEIPNPQLRNQVQATLNAMAGKQQALIAAQQKMQSVMLGR
ncbi:DUF3053 family protein [Bosea caraganae]|uniref:DUF3053 family protein n=1 Tax=Bosea caraganae TaxID=2763117 RepID=A0A370KZR1_9HYPH|nr:DUF3053 family protein [Bosea caraganae]RDJ20488.1 DUF3053 family protein [Bosea caraganae]RDJ30003.1 DUF3053 family protein [Bosea caraganae]